MATLVHNRGRHCPRYGEQIAADACTKRPGEDYHRCPHCGAAMSDADLEALGAW